VTPKEIVVATQPAGDESDGRSRVRLTLQCARPAQQRPRTALKPAPATRPARPPRPATLRQGTRDLAVRLTRDARALATAGGVRGALLETAWVAAHLTIYPLGILRERPRDVERYGYQHLTLRQRSLVVTNVEAASTPILLVHGMIDNRAIFTVLTRRLRAHGFERVVTLNYSPVTNDLRAAAEGLAAQVEELVASTGYERIHIVGHSLGGLIARYYVQRLGGDERVHTLVTLGTPHHGTLAAHLVPVRLGRQLRPSSDLFAELDLPAPTCRTRFVAMWSDIDQLVLPHDNSRLRHPDLIVHNELVHGVGHLSMPINARIVQRVCQVLGELNSDGSSLSAGVVPLRPS
jgi:triacylglycerol lipase